MSKLIFYIGFHDREKNDSPYKQEILKYIEMDIKKAGKLLRALSGVFNYLTTGENSNGE